MAPPELSKDQRLSGAAKSLEVRRNRADIKAWLGDAALDKRRAFLWQALELDAAQGMRVRALLMALKGVGHKRSAEMLAKAGIKPAASVRSLGWRQRAALLDQLRPK